MTVATRHRLDKHISKGFNVTRLILILDRVMAKLTMQAPAPAVQPADINKAEFPPLSDLKPEPIFRQLQLKVCRVLNNKRLRLETSKAHEQR